MKLSIQTTNKIIAKKVHIADTFMSRFFGLMGKSKLSLDECLWIKKCNSIHTSFMKFSIDVIYLNKNLEVLDIKENISPWRFTLPVLKADSVIELPAQRILGKVKKGDQLYVGA